MPVKPHQYEVLRRVAAEGSGATPAERESAQRLVEEYEAAQPKRPKQQRHETFHASVSINGVEVSGVNEVRFSNIVSPDVFDDLIKSFAGMQDDMRKAAEDMARAMGQAGWSQERARAAREERQRAARAARAATGQNTHMCSACRRPCRLVPKDSHEVTSCCGRWVASKERP